MESDSQHKESLRVLEGQIRECFGRVAYSHKTHEKCADIIEYRHALIKNTQIILSVVTTGGIIQTFFGASNVGVYIAAVTSTALVMLNVYLRETDLGKLAQKHREAAADLWLVREKYFSLLTNIVAGNLNYEEAASERDNILNTLYDIYKGAPSTNSKAYVKAQKALKSDEELTFSDSEIDVMLPSDLRRASSKAGL